MATINNDWKLATPPEYEWEDDEPEEYDPADDCMLMPDGQCMAAGSEWCDFECPFRDSPDFAGNEPDRATHTGAGE